MTDYPIPEYPHDLSQFHLNMSFKAPVKSEALVKKISDTGSRHLLLRNFDASHSSVKVDMQTAER